MKKYLKVTSAVVLFFTLNLICKNLTTNFSTDFLVPPTDAGSEWDIPSSPDNLNEMLDQKYTYLSHGNQAYALESEDRKYVLKLFRSAPPTIRFSLFRKKLKFNSGKLPFVQLLFQRFYSEKCQEIRDLAFRSYVNSFSLLKNETQVEYLHLATTSHLKKSLIIYDRIGILRSIDLNSTCFLLQKKTDLLYPTLAKLIQNNELDSAKEILSNFVQLGSQMIKQEIINPTTLKKNIGCLGLHPVQIDIGKVLRKQDLPSISMLST